MHRLYLPLSLPALSKHRNIDYTIRISSVLQKANFCHGKSMAARHFIDIKVSLI